MPTVSLECAACLDVLAAKALLASESSCSADLRAKLDKSTTAIVLNVAAGNGRFTGADQSHFYVTAYKAAIQSAALLALVGGIGIDAVVPVEEGRELFRRVAAMLTGLFTAHFTDCLLPRRKESRFGHT